MDVSIPMAVLAFKDGQAQKLRKSGYSEDNSDLVKRAVAIEILLAMIS